MRNSYRLKVSIPGNIEYVAIVRKFVSEVLLSTGYTQKFAYRTEVIVDEICSNAVVYGCRAVSSHVHLECRVDKNRVEIEVKDQGGSRVDIRRLREALEAADRLKEKPLVKKPAVRRAGLGLEIVKMLSEKLILDIDDNNVTSIRVMRKREGIESSRK